MKLRSSFRSFTVLQKNRMVNHLIEKNKSVNVENYGCDPLTRMHFYSIIYLLNLYRWIKKIKNLLEIQQVSFLCCAKIQTIKEC